MKSLGNSSYSYKTGCNSYSSSQIYGPCHDYVSYYSLRVSDNDFDNMTSFTFTVNGNYSGFSMSGSYVQKVFVLKGKKFIFIILVKLRFWKIKKKRGKIEK